MKKKLEEKIAIPEGVSCTYGNKILKCKKSDIELERKIEIPGITLQIKDNDILLTCEEGNKRHYKIIKTHISHIKNIFSGLKEKFVYKLEACNVHFPMNIKVEGDKLSIMNFLGEKTPRYAKILPTVNVDVKGPQITVSSHNLEAAGQTASNIELATKVRRRDRRIFQDGIFLTEKPRGAI